MYYLSRMYRIQLAIVATLFFLCTACRPLNPKTETELYFGLSIPGGGVVADSSWLRFEQEEIVRVFPKGYTVIPANGVWKGPGGRVSENSRVVVALNEMTAPLSARIDSLRERYKADFRQESVMRVDKAVERWDF